MPYKLHEVFGYYPASHAPDAVVSRASKDCPFRPPGVPCTKVSAVDPIGICSIDSGAATAVVCPVRFHQSGIVVRDAAREAFGPGATYVALPEFEMMTNVLTGQKVGKVDFVVIRVDPATQTMSDWCLLEIQAVYVSGASQVASFRQAMEGHPGAAVKGHPDFRSSHVKRLLPQLMLKVPVVRNWGKKVFVAVDSSFYASFPPPVECAPTVAQVTWLVYDLVPGADQSTLRLAQVVPTMLDDSVEALYSVTRPTQAEMEAHLASRVGGWLYAGGATATS